MATATQDKQAGRSRSGDNHSHWTNGQTGAIVGAAVAGAAVGLAANMGRKLFVQFSTSAGHDWMEALKAEHDAARALFDKIEGTDEDQTTMRSHLLLKLKEALTKHAIEEENVIYPALREANEADQADHLDCEHGYVKTYLYELTRMDKDDPAWIARVRDFRAMIEDHMREEENEIFPPFRARMTDEQNEKLTMMMNKEGLKVA